MWKTNMVRFRPLILHDITWYNMGLPHKMEPQTPMSYHNSLKQQVRGALHTETNMAIIGGMVIHPIMGIFIYIHRIFTGLITSPHLGKKTMAHVDEVVPRRCMALGKSRQPQPICEHIWGALRPLPPVVISWHCWATFLWANEKHPAPCSTVKFHGGNQLSSTIKHGI